MIRWGGRLVWLAWVGVLLIVALWLLRPCYAVTPRTAYSLIGLSVLVLVITARATLRTLIVPSPIVSGLSGFLASGAVITGTGGLYLHLFGTATAAPPSFITDVTAPSQFDSVLAYARGLSYDSTTHNAPDSTLIVDTVGGGLHITKAWISPAVGANFMSYCDLSSTGPGRGRVVARIRVDTTYGSRGYPELHLPAGVSYVWIDSLELRDTTGTFRAFVIPATRGGSVIRLPDKDSHYYSSRRAFSNFAMARWVLYKHSNCTNVPCGGGKGCCQSCP